MDAFPLTAEELVQLQSANVKFNKSELANQVWEVAKRLKRNIIATANYCNDLNTSGKPLEVVSDFALSASYLQTDYALITQESKLDAVLGCADTLGFTVAEIQAVFKALGWAVTTLAEANVDGSDILERVTAVMAAYQPPVLLY